MFFIGKIHFFHPWMFWTSPAAPKKSFSSPLGVPNLACGAKKKNIHRPDRWNPAGQKMRKIIFRNGLRKKNIHGRPENSRELKNAKNHFSQMACEKKTFTAPPIWGVRKKTFTAPQLGGLRKKIIHHGSQNRKNAKNDFSHKTGIPAPHLGQEILNLGN